MTVLLTKSSPRSAAAALIVASALFGLDTARAAPRTLPFGEELSERERAVLSLLPTDLSTRDIAASLFVSVNTVKTQTQAIYRKLGVTSRAEAVIRARELGLI